MKTTTILIWILLLPSTLVAEPLLVFVSVLPQKTFVEQVGGSHVEVRAMVRPGHDPHTYDPTPQQVAALAGAVLYVRTGVPFEDAWMTRIRSANPGMRVLDARQGIDLRAMEHHEHEGEAEHTGHGHAKEHDDGHSSQDPHVWTSPPLVKLMAGNIRETLIALDPSHEADYKRNYQAFAAELDALDQDIRNQLTGLKNRKFMVFHPAWGYFADTYDLTQVAIEHEGKQPGARALTGLIQQARRENIKAIFVQPQFDRKFAQQIAGATGGRVIVIDPLATDYADNLRQVTRQLAEVLQP